MAESFQNIFILMKRFRDERDWSQFHNAKDLALALSIEASELNELFLWKKSEDVSVENIKSELADVLIYAFYLAEKYDLDILQIVHDKLEANALKYPVDKAKGNSTKYDQL
jgi:NTP pyrophosphatase (non-canonical NTP hydrolase)